MKTEPLARTKQGKRVYLNDTQTRKLMKTLEAFFKSYVDMPRIRVGTQQTNEMLINEEALLLAAFLRDEGHEKPRNIRRTREGIQNVLQLHQTAPKPERKNASRKS